MYQNTSHAALMGKLSVTCGTQEVVLFCFSSFEQLQLLSNDHVTSKEAGSAGSSPQAHGRKPPVESQLKEGNEMVLCVKCTYTPIYTGLAEEPRGREGSGLIQGIPSLSSYPSQHLLLSPSLQTCSTPSARHL